MVFRAAVRRLRAWPPLNRPLTTVLRALCGSRAEILIRHLPRVGDVRTSLPNDRTLVLRTKGDDWMPNQVFWRGWDGYEQETARAFYRLAMTARCTVDVGAFVGFYALLAGHANPTGRVLAYEPLPALYRRLLDNVAANKLPNILCEQKAVGRASGRADFYHLDVALPSSSGLSRDFMTSGGHDVRRMTVDVVALDDELPRLGIDAVDLVKVDTESTEPDVIAGMLRTIARDRPDIIAEVLDGLGTRDELRRMLAPLGYVDADLTELRVDAVAERTGVNVLFTARHAGRVTALTQSIG